MHKLFFALFLGMAVAAGGQVLDATHAGDSVKLAGDWRFHEGDDSAWSRPDLDDSSWRLVSTKKDWDAQGLQRVRGYFWYRTRVKLSEQTDPLALLVTESGPYDLYIDGKRSATYGAFPPHPQIWAPFPRSYPIPPGTREISIALRFWVTPIAFYVRNMADNLWVGTKAGVERQARQSKESTLVQESPDFIILAIEVILCVELLVLFYLQRERTEYLFLALVILTALVAGLIDEIQSVVPMSLISAKYASLMSQNIMSALTIEFVFRFLGQPVPKWLRVYQISMTQLWIVLALAYSGWVSTVSLNIFLVVYLVPYWFSIPGILLWRFARGNKEAGLLAIPLSLLMLNAIVSIVGWTLYQLHLLSSPNAALPSFQIGEVSIPPDTVTVLLFLLSITALILVRFQKTRLEQARAQAELEAARSMQEVMVPHTLTAHGFKIETAYIPAAEVGGDFFQLFPGDEGSLLVVIGDVSGKGMKAAMLVSMILGLLRRTVDQTRSPAGILNDVNRLLIGNTDGRFATCCCALINPDGAMTVANAGHLSPYCDGEEIEFPGGMPLGLSAEADYQNISILVQPGKRLVFLSDGVVEARNKAGELYGFERTRSISIRTVDEIAQTAQRFGQEDDITVLGIVAFA